MALCAAGDWDQDYAGIPILVNPAVQGEPASIGGDCRVDRPFGVVGEQVRFRFAVEVVTEDMTLAGVAGDVYTARQSGE